MLAKKVANRQAAKGKSLPDLKAGLAGEGVVCLK